MSLRFSDFWSKNPDNILGLILKKDFVLNKENLLV